MTEGKRERADAATELEDGGKPGAHEPEIVGGTPVGHGQIPALLVWVIGFCVVVAGVSWITFRGY